MTATTVTPPAIPARHEPRDALAVRGRPGRAGAVSASLTFAWRALRKLQHVP
jgi:hypothetical protein